MLKALGQKARIVDDPRGLLDVTRIILPGVGHFDHGIAELRARGLVDCLNARVLDDGIPFLGICLGAQLIARRSEEGNHSGLGWIAADVVAFDPARMNAELRVPHMGWAETWVAPGADLPTELSAAMPEEARFYYVHSFHLICDAPEQAVLRAHHGYEFAAGVRQDNILAVQFHPEKSHHFGKALLKAFIDWSPRMEPGPSAAA
jgi:glutamine amidotransferase